jgi:hypothetical protein
MGTGPLRSRDDVRRPLPCFPARDLRIFGSLKAQKYLLVVGG